jgi:uncharacterized ion transporter superfamily protein YfcC
MDEQRFLTIGKKSFTGVLIILAVLIVLAGVLGYLVPQGMYPRNELGEIIGPYEALSDPTALPIWKILFSFVLIFTTLDALPVAVISLFLLILGGTFQVMQSAQGIQVFLERLVQRFKDRKYLLLRMMVLLFMSFGAFFGIFEESVALMPIVILLSISLGWDTMVGVGMSLMAAAFGFASAITNPFSIGIAASLADISVLSGGWLRVVVFMLMYLLLSTFLVRYAKKIEKDPKKSISYEEDQKKVALGLSSVEPVEPNQASVIYKAYVTLFVVLLATVLLTSLLELFAIVSIPSILVMAVVFLFGGWLAGYRISRSWKWTLRAFFKGVQSLLPALVLIFLAAGVKYIVSEAMIMDTILFELVALLSQYPAIVSILLIYLFVLFLEFFIGSASAKAILLMPILLPLVDLIGISKELAILPFLFGDGYANIIYPTNAVLLIGLSIASIKYSKWFKWTLGLQLIVLALTSVILILAQWIGY